MFSGFGRTCVTVVFQHLVVLLLVNRGAAEVLYENPGSAFPSPEAIWDSRYAENDAYERDGHEQHGSRVYDRFQLSKGQFPRGATINRIRWEIVGAFPVGEDGIPDPLDVNAWELTIWSNKSSVDNVHQPNEPLFTEILPADEVHVEFIGATNDEGHPWLADQAIYDATVALSSSWFIEPNSIYWLSCVALVDRAIESTGVSIGWSGSGGGSSYQDFLTADAQSYQREQRGTRHFFTLEGDPTSAGDFDHDGQLDESDIDALSMAIRTGIDEFKFDTNQDGSVNLSDHQHWILTLKRTYSGDANLDGAFDTSDLIRVFQDGQYEDTVEDNSIWSTGDWNADGDFDTSDLVVAFVDGGFEKGTQLNGVAVPEPAFHRYALLMVCWMLARKVARIDGENPRNHV